MRFLFVLSICLCVVNSIALGQQINSSRSIAPAPQKQTTPQVTPKTVPPQTVPPKTVPPKTVPPQTAPPQTAPPQTAPPQADDLSLDSNQSYNFSDLDSSQYASASDPQSSIASNSDFRGASPQMIGDFGGGSTILSLGTPGDSSPISVQIPLAGGSRRIKAAENNQVQPLNRFYGTFNYFDNAIVSDAAGAAVKSENLYQYTMGFEKTFLEYFSIDVRMPLVGIIDHTAISGSPGVLTSAANVRTSGVGNLSTSIKALLLQMGQTSISGGLSLSIPTGSEARIVALQQTSAGSPDFYSDYINVDNDALHLMPFIGVYRQFGKSWWLQAFTQVDTPSRGNDVRTNGLFVGRLKEQTLLYADVSLGKWLYRNQCKCCRCRQRCVTGIASIFELHYTGSLNDADQFTVGDGLGIGTDAQVGSRGNRFDVLNLTMGLQVEFSEQWRINVAGVVPLRERQFDATGPRREGRFFDGELSIQVNRLF